jgi:hypothetical protein
MHIRETNIPDISARRSHIHPPYTLRFDGSLGLLRQKTVLGTSFSQANPEKVLLKVKLSGGRHDSKNFAGKSM